MVTRSVVLAAVVGLGCQVPDDVVSDTDEELTDDRETALLCRSDLASCHEQVYVEITARVGIRSCEEDAGPDERCVASVARAYASIFDDGVTEPGGCDLSFWVDERMVPVGAFVPNSEYPEVGFGVQLTDDAYVVRLTGGFSHLQFEGCQGTEAAALVSEGYLDEVLYTLDLEPSDVHYREPLQHLDELDDSVGVQPHPVYDGVLELRAGDVRLRVPMQSHWTPVGGPDDLQERSDDEWLWDILWTGPTRDVRSR